MARSMRTAPCASAKTLSASSSPAGSESAATGQAAELPAQNKKPIKAEPAKTCDIAGNPGVLAANGVCVRFSGYVSSQFSGGNLREQYK